MTDEATTQGAKKGLPVWGWVLIGCGGLIVLGFVAMAALGIFAVKKGAEMAKEVAGVDSLEEFRDAMEDDPAKFTAEMMIRANPDLEIVSTDDDAGTLTFRDKKTGEEATLNFEDIAEGKFSITTDEGEFSMAASDDGDGGVVFKGPEGESRYGTSASLDDVPNWVPVYPDAEETVGTFSTTSAEGVSGSVTMKTSDGAADVLDHYAGWFEDNGWEVRSRSTSSTGDGAFATIVGAGPDGARTLTIGAIEQKGETQVSITYNETAD